MTDNYVTNNYLNDKKGTDNYATNNYLNDKKSDR